MPTHDLSTLLVIDGFCIDEELVEEFRVYHAIRWLLQQPEKRIDSADEILDENAKKLFRTLSTEYKVQETKGKSGKLLAKDYAINSLPQDINNLKNKTLRVFKSWTDEESLMASLKSEKLNPAQFYFVLRTLILGDFDHLLPGFVSDTVDLAALTKEQ